MRIQNLFYSETDKIATIIIMKITHNKIIILQMVYINKKILQMIEKIKIIQLEEKRYQFEVKNKITIITTMILI